MEQISISFEDILQKVPEKDEFGNYIPKWKRDKLAQKAYDDAKKELEESVAREAEAKRQEEELKKLEGLPAWKREMVLKKAAEKAEEDARREREERLRKEEEARKREEEQKKLESLPIWKRHMIEKNPTENRV